MNYLLRYLRWEMYLRALDIRVPLSVSASVFVVGLALSITRVRPGNCSKASG